MQTRRTRKARRALQGTQGTPGTRFSKLNKYVQHPLAPRARTIYSSGLRQYVNFCSSRFTPFRMPEPTLCLFATTLADNCISYNTIKVYLYAIQHHNSVMGYRTSMGEMNFLHIILLEGFVVARVILSAVHLEHPSPSAIYTP